MSTKRPRYLTAKEKAEFVESIEKVLQKRADDAAKKKDEPRRRDRRQLEKPMQRLIRTLAGSV